MSCVNHGIINYGLIKYTKLVRNVILNDYGHVEKIKYYINQYYNSMVDVIFHIWVTTIDNTGYNDSVIFSNIWSVESTYTYKPTWQTEPIHLQVFTDRNNVTAIFANHTIMLKQNKNYDNYSSSEVTIKAPLFPHKESIGNNM